VNACPVERAFQGEVTDPKRDRTETLYLNAPPGMVSAVFPVQRCDDDPRGVGCLAVTEVEARAEGGGRIAFEVQL
jgi:hypothetical protein